MFRFLITFRRRSLNNMKMSLMMVEMKIPDLMIQKRDDSDDPGDGLFDLIVDREARRVLFDLLHITYYFVRCYKAAQFNSIIANVAAKFEVSHLPFFLSLHSQITTDIYKYTNS